MKRSLFLLPALLAAGLASAQNAFDFRVADLGLLQAKPIQTDVGITSAQRAKLNVAADANKSRLLAYEKQLKALGSSVDKARLQGLFTTFKQEALAVLTPAQLARLREITLQRLGLISLTDSEVATKVGLSAAQVARLKSTFDAGRAKFVALQQATAGPILAPYRGRKPKDKAQAVAWEVELKTKLQQASVKVKPQLVAIGKTTDESMLAVLSPAQRAKWNALKGRPFKAR